MTRWKAGGLHLCISAAVGLVAAVLIFGVWYPPPFFHAAGGGGLILLLVGVDLGLGPLLTLIVFRHGKPGLKFDLATIGVIQTAALLWGMHIIVDARPVFLVAAVDRLVLVAADEISDADLALGSEPTFRTRSWSGPRLVAARMPTDIKERSDLAFSAFAGRDLQNLPKYYCSYAEGGRDLLRKAKPLAALIDEKPQARQMIENWLASSKRGMKELVWVPLQGDKSDLVMLLDAETALPVHAIAIDPW